MSGGTQIELGHARPDHRACTQAGLRDLADQVDLGIGKLDLSAFYVHTDRTQDEDSLEYNGPTQNENINTLSVFNNNDVDITQDSYALTGKYTFDMFGGETAVKLGYARFENEEFEFEDEIEYLRDATPFPDGDRFTGDATTVNLEDSEYSAKLEHKRELSDDLKIQFGVQFEKKERDNLIQDATRIRFNLPAGTAVPTSGMGTLYGNSGLGAKSRSKASMGPRMTSPMASWLAGTSSSDLSALMRRALVGVSLMSDSMEARAPSAVRVSMISPMSMKNATTPAS